MAGLCECVMEVHPENISLNQDFQDFEDYL